MNPRLLHRLLILLILLALWATLSGALRSPGHQLVSILTAAGASAASIWGWALGHRILPTLIILTVGIESASGFWEQPFAPALHAVLAQIVFALLAAFLVVTGPDWRERSTPMADRASLRNLSAATGTAVGLQMLLGAAFRHQFAPVWPHIAGSFLAACLLLMAAMSIYDHYAAHPRLKRYGPWLLGITLSQLALGLAAYTLRVIGSGWLAVAAAAHVTLGAITLAAALMFALDTHRHLSAPGVAREATA